MSIHPIMQKLADKHRRTDLPEFAPGDTIRVQVKIKEGEKERLQAFEGMVIACKKGPQGTFTVRKMSFGQGVERIFPLQLHGRRQDREGPLLPGAPLQTLLPPRPPRQGCSSSRSRTHGITICTFTNKAATLRGRRPFCSHSTYALYR